MKRRQGTIRKRGTSWEWMHNAPPGYDRKYITGTRKTKREAAAALAASIAGHDRRQASSQPASWLWTTWRPG